jgi:hypothetical protein
MTGPAEPERAAELEVFEAVRREPDPLQRARRALELHTVYKQRVVELSRLRRAAIEDAYRSGMSYTDIAGALGVTKGRITQIRSNSPAAERAFFGVGPVTVALPVRYGVTDRERPLIAAEDTETAARVEQVLASLSLATARQMLEPTSTSPPAGDAVVICGPKSAPVGASLLAEDPRLGMVQADGRWWINVHAEGKRHGSPIDASPAQSSDLAYIARHILAGRVVVHIAGLHAIGSLGAIEYISRTLPELFADQGETEFSLAIRCTFNGLKIASTELAAGPFPW